MIYDYIILNVNQKEPLIVLAAINVDGQYIAYQHWFNSRKRNWYFPLYYSYLPKGKRPKRGIIRIGKFPEDFKKVIENFNIPKEHINEFFSSHVFDIFIREYTLSTIKKNQKYGLMNQIFA